jgi:hypothetical protein
MKKFFSGLLLTQLLICCNKNDASLSKNDYAFFLANSTPTFFGKLNGKPFSWTYGWNQSQSLAGFENGNGICDSTDPVRVVLYGLTSEMDLQTRFILYSPKYNSQSEADISRVFSVGTKKLGDFRSDFHLKIYKDNQYYQSNGLSAKNEIEILKTEEFSDNFGKKLRVWFRIDARLSSCSCQNNNASLSDGLMIAEFSGFKKNS